MIRRYRLFFFLCLVALLGVGGYATAQSSDNPNQPQPSKPAPATPGSGAPKGGKTQLYGLGDQMFLINAGVLAPLFTQDPSNGMIYDPQLTAGGVGSLEVDVYLNNNLNAGVEFGGAFTFDVNKQPLFLIPVIAKIAWTFHVYPFDFPIYFGAGVDFMRLNNQLYVGPILKPGAAGYWNITSKWSVGIRAEYWWVPEIYTKSNPTPSSRSRFGNFITVSLSGLYHF